MRLRNRVRVEAGRFNKRVKFLSDHLIESPGLVNKGYRWFLSCISILTGGGRPVRQVTNRSRQTRTEIHSSTTSTRHKNSSALVTLVRPSLSLVTKNSQRLLILMTGRYLTQIKPEEQTPAERYLLVRRGLHSWQLCRVEPRHSSYNNWLKSNYCKNAT